jgi:myosin heavy subunit
LSPLDQSLAKQFTEDEDDFAFSFNRAFDCDLNEFLALDRDSVIAKLKNRFSNAKQQLEATHNDRPRLTDEVNALRAKLNTVKLALADKDVQLFEMSRSNQSATVKQTAKSPALIHNTTLAQTGAPAGPPFHGPRKSLSNQRIAKTKPTLITWLNKGVSKTEASLNKIDSLMNLDPDGPTVQQFKKSEDRVTFTFKDIAARDKARTLISQNSQQVLFKSVSVPPKTYPAIARLNGLSDIQTITGADSQSEKRLRSTAIMESIQKENPPFPDKLVSVRLLSNQPATSTFHVRLGLSSKDSCDQLIDRGRVIVDSRTHAVAMADPSKEIRHCLRSFIDFAIQRKKIAVNVSVP